MILFTVYGWQGTHDEGVITLADDTPLAQRLAEMMQAELDFGRAAADHYIPDLDDVAAQVVMRLGGRVIERQPPPYVPGRVY